MDEKLCWDLTQILEATKTKTLCLNNPQYSFRDSLYLIAALIHQTSIQTFKFKNNTVDLMDLRKCEKQFLVSLMENYVSFQPCGIIPDSLINLLKTMGLLTGDNTIPYGSSVFGLVPFLMSLEPAYIESFISLDEKFGEN